MFLSFSKENGIYRIQSAFEIMWLNEHTKFVNLPKTGTHGKNLYLRYQNGIPQIRVIVSPSDYGFIEQVRQVNEIPQSTRSKQTSSLQHPRRYIVHGNTPIFIVLINTLTSNTTEQISPKSPNLLKNLDRLPKHSKIYAEQQSLFSLCTYMC